MQRQLYFSFLFVTNHLSEIHAFTEHVQTNTLTICSHSSSGCLICINILAIVNSIQQTFSTHFLRTVRRQIQHEEAGMRHWIVLIGMLTIHLVNGMFHAERLRTTPYSFPSSLLQRKTTSSPHKLQIQLTLLI